MTSNAIEIIDLKKRYTNNFTALQGINLTVKQGDFFALLGPNGAGKTTTIGIITSLVNKTSGKVLVFNQDLDSAPHAVKMLIGLVPQEFNFNIFERVQQSLIKQAGYFGIPPTKAAQISEKYLKKLGLWQKKDDRIRFLSGGQKRRLMIVRALLHEPPLLILDEPTAGVDIEVRRYMWRFLREINENGTTIILTTHYLEEAENLCKNIAIIQRGNIIENTSMKSLLSKLEQETFVLTIDTELKSPPALSCHSQVVDSHLLEIEVTKKTSLNQIFAELSDLNINVTSLRNKTNRLEELFFNLTKQDHEADNA
jgi:ABC-2 type transport system ATP-binding protein